MKNYLKLYFELNLCMAIIYKFTFVLETILSLNMSKIKKYTFNLECLNI